MGRLSSTFPTAQAVDAALKRANKAEVDVFNLNAETRNLQEQINQIVRAPESGGDVAAEVAQARVDANGVSHDTLKDRLDDEITDLNTDLTLTSGNIMKNILSMNQDGEIIMLNGKVVQKGMLDVNDGHFYLAPNDVRLGASEHYIPLEIGKTYNIVTTGTGFNLCFYDINKDFIDALYKPNTTKTDPYTFTNTSYSYMRIAAWKSGTGITQDDFDAIVVSTDVSTEVVQARVDANGVSHDTLKDRLDDEIIDLNTDLTLTSDNIMKNILSMNQDGKIIMLNGKVVQKGMLDVDDGHFYLATSDARLGASEHYIPLEIGKTYDVTTTGTGFNLCFYDANKGFIDALYKPNTTKTDPYTFTNTEYSYVRVAAWKSGTGITQEDFNAIKISTSVDNLKIQNAELVPMDFIEVDTVNATIKFTGTTQVRNGKTNRQIASNTIFDISGAISGGFLYYDYDESSIVTANVLTHKQVLIGAVWANGNVILFVPDRYVKVNGKVLGNNVWNLIALNGVNLDIESETITFGKQAYFTDGYKVFSLSTDPYSVTGMTSGTWMYYNFKDDTFSKVKSNDSILVGAIWTNGSIQFSGQQHLVTADGLPVVYGQRLFNKTANCLGDSMTEGVGTSKPYHKWFPLLCGLKTVRNYGLGGSCIAPKKETYPEWEAGLESFLERYTSMADADVVTVFGGVNDWVCGRTLGTVNDTTDDTFYGAMHLLCRGLISKYPTSKIYFFTSPQNDYVHRPANIPSDSQYYGNTEGKNRKGNTLIEFVDAMVEVCGLYGIPCKDLYRNSWYGLSGVLGIWHGDPGPYGADSLHPNEEGHKILALKMSSFINSN